MNRRIYNIFLHFLNSHVRYSEIWDVGRFSGMRRGNVIEIQMEVVENRKGAKSPSNLKCLLSFKFRKKNGGGGRCLGAWRVRKNLCNFVMLWEILVDVMELLEIIDDSFFSIGWIGRMTEDSSKMSHASIPPLQVSPWQVLCRNDGL